MEINWAKMFTDVTAGVIARSEIPKKTGGIVTFAMMNAIESFGEEIGGKFMIGKKRVGYPVLEVVKWLQKNYTKMIRDASEKRSVEASTKPTKQNEMNYLDFPDSSPPEQPEQTAVDVAKYFIIRAKKDNDTEDDVDLSMSKLQDLCYIALGVFAVAEGKKLFREAFKAWKFGLVLPSVYHEFRNDGIRDYVGDYDDLALCDKDKDVLNAVYVAFSQYSSWRLREITKANDLREKYYDETAKQSVCVPHAVICEEFKQSLEVKTKDGEITYSLSA